jgi:hypothetical protein
VIAITGESANLRGTRRLALVSRPRARDASPSLACDARAAARHSQQTKPRSPGGFACSATLSDGGIGLMPESVPRPVSRAQMLLTVLTL